MSLLNLQNDLRHLSIGLRYRVTLLGLGRGRARVKDRVTVGVTVRVRVRFRLEMCDFEIAQLILQVAQIDKSRATVISQRRVNILCTLDIHKQSVTLRR